MSPEIDYSEMLRKYIGDDTPDVDYFLKAHLRIRELTKGSIETIQQLLLQLKPKSPYVAYDYFSDVGIYTFQPTRYLCLGGVVRNIYYEEPDSNRFAFDKSGQIIAAAPQALVPNVDVFTGVIRTKSVSPIPKDHLAIQLYLHSKIILEEVNRGGDYTIGSCLLAEAFDERIWDELHPERY